MKTATLGEVARYINGFAFKSDDWGDEGLRIIRIQNLNDPTKPYNRTTRVVKDDLRVRQGDLLVSWSASLGVYEWTDAEDAWLNQHIFRVVPDEDRVDRHYLKRALESVLSGLGAKTQGATMKHLTRGVFLNTQIPLPPIEEQRRIAAVLDAAGELRAKRREALAKLDALTQAIFIDMFGTLREESPGPPTALLGDVAEILNGDRGKNYPKSSEFVDDGVPFVNAGHLVGGDLDLAGLNFVTDEVYERLRAGKFTDTDLLFCIRGSLGKVGRVPAGVRGAIASSLVVIRPRPIIHRDYLLHVLASPLTTEQISDWDNGTAQPNLGAGSLAKFKIPLPALDEQERFLQALERLPRAAHLDQLRRLDTLFSSLQHKAFKGEL